MNDDEDYELRQTIRFEDFELEDEGPSGPDEWLKVLDGQDVMTMTDPFRPALDLKSTRKMDVPSQLLDQSRGSGQDSEWQQHFSVVDHRGYLVVRLREGSIRQGDHVEVLIRKVPTSDE